MDKVEFKSIINNIMINNGFVKKGNSWYKIVDECIVMLNLQHSSFSNLYYINLACFIRKRDDRVQYPKENHCHIRMRTPEIGNNGENYSLITDLDSEILDSSREEQLTKMIINYCIPVLSKLESIDGIKQLYSEKPNLNYKNPYNSLGI